MHMVFDIPGIIWPCNPHLFIWILIFRVNYQYPNNNLQKRRVADYYHEFKACFPNNWTKNYEKVYVASKECSTTNEYIPSCVFCVQVSRLVLRTPETLDQNLKTYRQILLCHVRLTTFFCDFVKSDAVVCYFIPLQ